MKQDKTKSKNANPQNKFPQNISAAQQPTHVIKSQANLNMKLIS